MLYLNVVFYTYQMTCAVKVSGSNPSDNTILTGDMKSETFELYWSISGIVKIKDLFNDI